MDETKSVPQAWLKVKNKKDILNYILKHGGISRADLAIELGSTKTTVSKNANELVTDGILIETGKGNNQVGKKSTLLDINPDLFNFFVINLSGNMFNLGVFNLKNESLYNLELNIPNVNEIHSLLKEAIVKSKTSKTLTSCILSIPAVVHGTTITSNQEKYAKVFEKINEFCEENDIKLMVENDIDLLGEYILSKDDCQKNMILIGANYGIGSSIFIEGKLLKGEHNFAGEIGFTNPILVDGKIENLEKRCSVGGMIDKYFKETNILLNFKDFKKELEDENKILTGYVDNMIVEITQSILNMSYFLDIKNIVLTGVLFEIKDDILSRIEKRISELHIKDIVVKKTEYSTKSNGGAMLVAQRQLFDLVK